MAEKKRKSITLILRNYFITGVVVLIPIGFTLYLSKILIGLSSKLIPPNINPNNYLPYSIPGIEIIISVIFITVVGGLSLSFLGKRILKLIDDLFRKIPVLRTIYSAILQMTETFSNKDSKDKKSVVLIEYPRKSCCFWCPTCFIWNHDRKTVNRILGADPTLPHHDEPAADEHEKRIEVYGE